MLTFELDKSRSRALTCQVYQQLRSQILSGALPKGERLPSTRSLSSELQISRNTVQTAYSLLESEGFLVSKSGSGVFVSRLPILLEPKAFVRSSEQTASLSPEKITPGQINFDSGLPAVSLFPRSNWNRTVSRAFLDAPDSALGYDDPQGRPELRTAIASWLEHSRGLRCEAGQILVTSGAKQGLTLIAKCLLSSASTVILEDPGNANIRRIVSYHTSRVLPIPVDREGLLTNRLPAEAHRALIVTTPSRQFPMGATLPLHRRIELLEYARKTDSFLVEDDYDSEFRYDSAPVRSLFELDGSRVIYVGTFSKYLFPSLRLGFLVLPRSLVPVFLEWKRLSDHHSNSVYQLALALWMESGAFERHIRRMKKVYAKKRAELIALLRDRFVTAAEVVGDASGLHLVASFPGVRFTPEFISRIRERGVYLVPVSQHSILDGHEDQLILGYGALEQEQMRLGLDILYECIAGYTDS